MSNVTQISVSKIDPKSEVNVRILTLSLSQPNSTKTHSHLQRHCSVAFLFYGVKMLKLATVWLLLLTFMLSCENSTGAGLTKDEEYNAYHKGLQVKLKYDKYKGKFIGYLYNTNKESKMVTAVIKIKFSNGDVYPSGSSRYFFSRGESEDIVWDVSTYDNSFDRWQPLIKVHKELSLDDIE